MLIDAPFKISEEMIKTLGITLVVHGTDYEENNVEEEEEEEEGGDNHGGDDDDDEEEEGGGEEEKENGVGEEDGDQSDVSSTSSRGRRLYPNDYTVPKRLGIFKEIPSPSPLTAGEIMARINAHRTRYERK